MKRTSPFLFSLIVIGAGTLFFSLFYWPSMKEIRGLKKEIAIGQIKGEEETRFSLELSTRKKNLADLQHEVDKLKNGLLDPDECSVLMNDLRGLFKRFGFENKSISLKGEEKRDRFEVVVVEVKLKSAFEEFYRFLVALEDLPYALAIDRLDLQGEGESGIDSLSARLTLSAPLDQRL